VFEKALEIDGHSSQIPIKGLPSLYRFIETPAFKEEFSIPVHKLVKQVKEEIERAHSYGAT